MKPLTLAAITLAAALSTPGGGAAWAQSASPYAGQERRAIKALSDDEMRNLMEARGMGLAKAAELNSYPGPAHVLELAAQLGLSDAQRAATETVFAEMRARARRVGAGVIEAEHDLDRAFAEARIGPAELQSRARAIGAMQGELRAIHLEAHVAQRALLTPEQIARYDALRGYSASATHGTRHDHR